MLFFALFTKFLYISIRIVLRNFLFIISAFYQSNHNSYPENQYFRFSYYSIQQNRNPMLLIHVIARQKTIGLDNHSCHFRITFNIYNFHGIISSIQWISQHSWSPHTIFHWAMAYYRTAPQIFQVLFHTAFQKFLLYPLFFHLWMFSYLDNNHTTFSWAALPVQFLKFLQFSISHREG